MTKMMKVLVLYLKDQHYQAVIPNQARSWPQEWITNVDTLSQIPRAGVASKPSSRHDTPGIDKSPMDDSAWMPPSTPSKSPNPFPTHMPRATSSSSKKQHYFETPARSSSTNSRSRTPRHTRARGDPLLATPGGSGTHVGSSTASPTNSKASSSKASAHRLSKLSTPQWFPSNTPQASSQKRPRLNIPDSTPVQPPQKKAKGISTPDITRPAHPTVRSKLHQPAVVTDSSWKWTCPHCSVLLTGTSSKNISSKRTSHMMFRHRDLPMNERATRINRTPIIEASHDLPEDQRDWTCPFCHAVSRPSGTTIKRTKMSGIIMIPNTRKETLPTGLSNHTADDSTPNTGQTAQHCRWILQQQPQATGKTATRHDYRKPQIGAIHSLLAALALARQKGQTSERDYLPAHHASASPSIERLLGNPHHAVDPRLLLARQHELGGKAFAAMPPT